MGEQRPWGRSLLKRTASKLEGLEQSECGER